MLTVSVKSLMTIYLHMRTLVLDFEVDWSITFLDLFVGDLPDELPANVVAQILHTIDEYKIIIMLLSIS